MHYIFLVNLVVIIEIYIQIFFLNTRKERYLKSQGTMPPKFPKRINNAFLFNQLLIMVHIVGLCAL